MRDPAGIVDVIGETVGLKELFNTLIQWSVASNENPEIFLIIQDKRESLDEVPDSFLPAQTSNIANEGRAGREEV